MNILPYSLIHSLTSFTLCSKTKIKYNISFCSKICLSNVFYILRITRINITRFLSKIIKAFTSSTLLCKFFNICFISNIWLRRSCSYSSSMQTIASNKFILVCIIITFYSNLSTSYCYVNSQCSIISIVLKLISKRSSHSSSCHRSSSRNKFSS